MRRSCCWRPSPPVPSLSRPTPAWRRCGTSQAAYEEAILAAERALALAAELGLPQPAPALGSRGTARCALGEQRGVEDMRQALGFLVEQGQGRAAAVLYNNLALIAWLYEGSRAAVAALQEGIDFCERRGLTEWALSMSAGALPLLAELGQVEQALVEAGPLADRLQAAGNVTFIEPRSLQLLLLAERGTHEQACAPDELVAAARDVDEPQRIAQAFTAAARLLLAQGQTQQASVLLVELSQVDGTRADLVYASLLPTLVRTAIALDDLPLARRLVDDVEPVMPLADNALASCRGLLAEAAEQQAEAAHLHAEAADCWREFANVPERAYALLGQGRCLLALEDPAAGEPLRQAAELFSSMGYRPVLAETEALIAQTTALASYAPLLRRTDPEKQCATTMQPNESARTGTGRHEHETGPGPSGIRRHASTRNDTNRHEQPSTWSRTRT